MKSQNIQAYVVGFFGNNMIQGSCGGDGVVKQVLLSVNSNELVQKIHENFDMGDESVESEDIERFLITKKGNLSNKDVVKMMMLVVKNGSSEESEEVISFINQAKKILKSDIKGLYLSVETGGILLMFK